MVDVCVIGGGVSGIAAAKALREQNLSPHVFEKGSLPGGLWRYRNDNGLSGIYDSLHLNTSKSLTAFSDFPMPREYPDYPDHRQFVRYLDAVIERFGLGSCFRYRTEVARIRPAEGRWKVDLADGTELRYDAVLVASGHHWKPRRPAFPGRFSGKVLHAHEYRTSGGFEGKRVLVVGIGNSGVDIACDLSKVAAATFLSTRRGAHVLPKYLLGRPIDLWGAGLVSYLPPRVQGWAMAALVRLARGSLSSYGLPQPAHRIDQAHPTLSPELLELLKKGRIHVRSDVLGLEETSVFFKDGTKESIDVIVTATGYEVSHPFLDGADVEPDGLYHQVVSPDRPGLYFIGLVQPFQGPVLGASEIQSRWVAGLIAGRWTLPDRARIQAAIEQQRRWRTASLVQTPRHGLEVDYHAYVRAIRREMKGTP
ncbi:MAG TPA: NAD(P)-binding domain-containing protein [Planctomycetota bacterium]|nr:NAD(P)-binding domain-containing protein [Planctomycetota bacterium]